MRTINNLQGKLIYSVLVTLLTVCNLNAYSQYELDTEFGINGYASALWEDEVNPDADAFASPSGLVEQPDGKIIAAGMFDYLYQVEGDDYLYPGNGVSIARWNSDGTLDNSFGLNGTVTLKEINDQHNIECETLILQEDGKIVIGGAFYHIGEVGDFEFYMARYNTDGSLDESFGNAGFVQSSTQELKEFSARKLIRLSDDRLLLAVNVCSAAFEDTRIAFYCFNSDGSVDESFGEAGNLIINPTDLAERVTSIYETPDGKIIFCGHGETGFEQCDFLVGRINSNGTLDETFGTDGLTYVPTTEGAYNMAEAIDLQEDNKIIVTGNSSDWFMSLSSYAMTRLNADGSIDESFGNNGAIVVSAEQDLWCGDAVLVDDNDEIYLAGYAKENEYETSIAILGFNANGTTNTEFGENGVVNQQFGFNNQKGKTLIKSSDGNIFVACDYVENDNSGGGFMLIRYKKVVTTNNDAINSKTTIRVYPNPTNSYICIETEHDNTDVEIVNVTGQIVITKRDYFKGSYIDISSLDNGVYFVRTSKNEKIMKLIKQ